MFSFISQYCYWNMCPSFPNVHYVVSSGEIISRPSSVEDNPKPKFQPKNIFVKIGLRPNLNLAQLDIIITVSKKKCS